MFRRHGNAAFRRRIGLARDVKEDRAALSFHSGKHVAVQHDHDVVEPVIAPHFLVTGRKGQRDRPVVKPVPRIIAPAGVRRQRLSGQLSFWREAFVRPVVDMNQLKRAGRRSTVALFFSRDNSRPPESTRNRDRTKPQNSPGSLTGTGAHFQSFRRFSRINHAHVPSPVIAKTRH